MESHVIQEHSRKEPAILKCKECDFTSTTKAELDEHMKTKKEAEPNCDSCVTVNDELVALKEKVKSLGEVEENYEVARKMFIEKEKELEKVNEIHMKEREKEGLDRLKLEDTVRRLTMENEKLKSKDNTYFNIFECLNQVLDSKGFKISKIDETHDDIPSKENVERARKETQQCESAVKRVIPRRN